jgi:hypothetical protein
MSVESSLLDAWQLRMPLTGSGELRQSSRQQISRLFLRLAGVASGASETANRSATTDTTDAEGTSDKKEMAEVTDTSAVAGASGHTDASDAVTDLTELAQELEQLARADKLGGVALQAELRSCQLCLVEQLLQGQPTQTGDIGQLRAAVNTWDSVKNTVVKTDALIEATIARLIDPREDRNTAGGGVSQGAGTAGNESQIDKVAPAKAKSLQHEIRTPLQGALLTAELMMEDIGHGDPVSQDDIRSIRTSIETAVRILNDFAVRAKAGGSSVSSQDAARRQNSHPPAGTSQDNQSNGTS